MTLVPILTSAGLAATLLASSAIAAAAGDLQSHIDLHIVEIGETGAEELVERDTVRPGELIHFTIKHDNLTEEAVEELVIVGPIPDGVSLKLGSEQSSREATFEIQAEMDPELDGLEWSTLPALRKIVAEDGAVTFEPVPEDIVEAIRWTLDAALPAGEAALNSYRVVVN